MAMLSYGQQKWSYNSARQNPFHTDNVYNYNDSSGQIGTRQFISWASPQVAQLQGVPTQAPSLQNRLRKPLGYIIVFVVVCLMLAGIGLTLGLTINKQDTTSVDSATPIPLPDTPELSLSIDSLTYSSGQSVMLDNGDHTLKCIATKVGSDQSIYWDFGDNNVVISQTSVLSDVNGDYFDVTSVVNVMSVTTSGLDTSISCSIDYPSNDGRKKRQASANLIIQVQRQSLAQSVQLMIDGTSVTNNAAVELNEGNHRFSCQAIDAIENVAAVLVFGEESLLQESVTTTIPRDGLQDVTSTIEDLLITSHHCNMKVTCAPVLTCNTGVDQIIGVIGGNLPDGPSASVTLEINTKPTHTIITPSSSSTWDSVSRIATVVEGDSYTFNCEVFGSDTKSDVTWILSHSFGLSSIEESTAGFGGQIDCQRTSQLTSMTFAFEHAKHHGQTLQCVARTSAGESTINDFLYFDIEVPPKQDDISLWVDSELVDTSEVVLTPGPHKFECITGNTRPVSTVSWDFGGQVVSQDAFVMQHSEKLIIGRSVINSKAITTDDCDKKVTCTVSNSAISTDETAPSVSVTLKISTAPSSASISVSSGIGSSFDSVTQTMTLTHGILYTLNCEVDGANPGTDFNWLFRLETSDSIYSDEASSSEVVCGRASEANSFPAFVADIDVHDERPLTCSASNSLGSVESKINVDVNVAPTSDNTVLKITTCGETKEFKDGDTIHVLEGSFTFECTSPSSTPSATIEWDFNGSSSSGESVMRSVTQDTTVTCTASNVASDYVGGDVTVEVTLDVKQPVDCDEIKNTYGASSTNLVCTSSAAYYIYPDAGSGVVRMQVWCDMDTDGGAWTVFQRRQDGSVDFYQDWQTYADGFGDVTGEHWLGNENIYTLTNQAGKTYELRVDLDDCFLTAFALYASFTIDTAGNNYALTLGAFDSITSTAGDSLTHHSGQDFSTNDDDNDNSGGNCAVIGQSGWWFNSCWHSNLNAGRYYLIGVTDPSNNGVVWRHWHPLDIRYSLKGSEMKLRPTT